MMKWLVECGDFTAVVESDGDDPREAAREAFRKWSEEQDQAFSLGELIRYIRLPDDFDEDQDFQWQSHKWFTEQETS